MSNALELVYELGMGWVTRVPPLLIFWGLASPLDICSSAPR